MTALMLFYLSLLSYVARHEETRGESLTIAGMLDELADLLIDGEPEAQA